jgi:hypothetical protein
MHLVYELNSRLRYYSNPRSKRKYKKTTREGVTDARPLVDAKIRLVSLKSDDGIWIGKERAVSDSCGVRAGYRLNEIAACLDVTMQP